MRVKVRVSDQELTISCGNGQQTFQWLATVVQQRLTEHGILRKSLQPENYIVTELRNAEGELINPKDRLYEHTSPSGLSLSATISNTFPTDSWENPVYNDWMTYAYLHADTNLNYAKEMEKWRTSLDDITTKGSTSEVYGLSSDAAVAVSSNEEAKRVKVNNTLLAAKAIAMTPSLGGSAGGAGASNRFIKVGFDFSDADVELAFNLDWQIMSWSWLQGFQPFTAAMKRRPTTTEGEETPLVPPQSAFPPITFNEVVKNKLGDVIKSNYALICNVFAHFAGVAKVGQRFGMTVEEFGHFVHFMRIYDWKKSSASSIGQLIVDALISKTSGDSGSVPSTAAEMHRAAEKKLSSSSTSDYKRDEGKKGFSSSTMSSKSTGDLRGNANSRWTLITRAHFTELLVCIALNEGFGHHVSHCVLESKIFLSFDDSFFVAGFVRTRSVGRSSN